MPVPEINDTITHQKTMAMPALSPTKKTNKEPQPTFTKSSNTNTTIVTNAVNVQIPNDKAIVRNISDATDNTSDVDPNSLGLQHKPNFMHGDTDKRCIWNDNDRNDNDNDGDDDDDDDDLVCTLRDVELDKFRDDESMTSSVSGKRMRKEFEPTLNKRPKKKRKKKHRNKEEIDIYGQDYLVKQNQEMINNDDVHSKSNEILKITPTKTRNSNSNSNSKQLSISNGNKSKTECLQINGSNSNSNSKKNHDKQLSKNQKKIPNNIPSKRRKKKNKKKNRDDDIDPYQTTKVPSNPSDSKNPKKSSAKLTNLSAIKNKKKNKDGNKQHDGDKDNASLDSY